MIVNINKADLTKGQAHPPGYYKVTCLEIKSAPSKNQESYNHSPVLEFEGTKDIYDGHNFNSKNMAAGMCGQFMAACAGISFKEWQDKTPDGALQFDTEKYKNIKLQINLGNRNWEGRLMDEIKGFLPYDAVAPF